MWSSSDGYRVRSMELYLYEHRRQKRRLFFRGALPLLHMDTHRVELCARCILLSFHLSGVNVNIFLFTPPMIVWTPLRVHCVLSCGGITGLVMLRPVGNV